MILASLLALAASTAAMGVALKALSLANPPQIVRREPPPPVPPGPDPRADAMAQQRELDLLEKQLLETRRHLHDLEMEAAAAPGQILALQQQQDQLMRQIEQRRASLRDRAKPRAARQRSRRRPGGGWRSCRPRPPNWSAA